jgi:hypothetical protein
MEYGDSGAEHSPYAGYCLRREGYFRYKNDHATATLHLFAKRLQIHQGLATPGYTKERGDTAW